MKVFVANAAAALIFAVMLWVVAYLIGCFIVWDILDPVVPVYRVLFLLLLAYTSRLVIDEPVFETGDFEGSKHKSGGFVK